MFPMGKQTLQVEPGAVFTFVRQQWLLSAGPVVQPDRKDSVSLQAGSEKASGDGTGIAQES